eukprot:CAMPEP_0204412356 /NCGR_PEP_ID=MMETSP0470-20130426/14182_1 /ASSEMBLY_ACC=CAM_ASM_000385 /TAXON_ID=2969 /ORGANISM="Oxyrrhis marina" /LENGTH=63 /DNA_ID=CAMNT_0051408425 /DNA_START=10 /DNA_END=198 /DNA_ORIENTATION=+
MSLSKLITLVTGRFLLSSASAALANAAVLNKTLHSTRMTRCKNCEARGATLSTSAQSEGNQLE